MKTNFQTHQNQTECFSTTNVNLAYDVLPALDKQKKPQILLLINGFQRTRQDFRAFRQKISREQSDIISIAFDNRFCGQTQFKPVLTTETIEQAATLIEFAKDSLALLKHCMHIFETNEVHVLGISMGGMIAQILASLPECPPLKTLFLVSTTAGGLNRIWPKAAHLRKDAPINASHPHHSEERLRLYFGEKFLKSSPLLFKMFVQNMQKTVKSENDMEFFKLQALASQNFEGLASYAFHAKKVVIISGDEDKIMPLENSEILSRLIPNSELIIYPKIGHLILIENPNEFVHDVARYLNNFQ